jgi:hypothetical protein
MLIMFYIFIMHCTVLELIVYSEHFVGSVSPTASVLVLIVFGAQESILGLLKRFTITDSAVVEIFFLGKQREMHPPDFRAKDKGSLQRRTPINH